MKLWPVSAKENVMIMYMANPDTNPRPIQNAGFFRIIYKYPPAIISRRKMTGPRRNISSHF